MNNENLKLLHQDKERSFYLVSEWTTNAGLPAKIYKCIWSDEVKAIASSLHDYYLGYVVVPEGKILDRDSLGVHGGITFGPKEMATWHGEVEDSRIRVGFDMNHYGDEDIENPEEYAKKECEELAKQINEIKE